MQTSSTEIWMNIPQDERYQVSDQWRIRSFAKYREWMVIELDRHRQWYLLVKIAWKRFLVHRLVAQAFLGLDISDLKSCVCHKNDVTDDNRAENLFIGTHKENMQDRAMKWRWWDIAGDKCPFKKLSSENVKKILERLSKGETAYQIQKDFPFVTYQAIDRIRLKKTWKWLSTE